MTCQELLDFLIDYTDGTLSPEERARFDHHLAICVDCRNYLASYLATVHMGRSALQSPSGTETEPPVPESLVQAILAARPKRPS